MSQHNNARIPLPLVGVILLCLLVGIYLLASRRFAKLDPSDKIIKHSTETSSDEALKYWTADKMREAKPADLPTTNAIEQGKQHL